MKLVTSTLIVAALIAVPHVARAGGDPRLPYARVRCGDGGTPDVLVLPQAEAATIEDKEVDRLGDAATAAGFAPARQKQQYTGWAEGTYSWCAAEKTVKIGKQSVAVIVSGIGEMTGLGGDDYEDAITVVAHAIGNKQLAKLVKDGALKRPAALAGEAAEDPVKQLEAALADRAKLARFWSTRDDVVLAGSAPGELYHGAKARQTLARWSLDLRIDGPVMAGSKGDLEWALANVEAKPVKGGAATTYRVLFVMTPDHPGDDAPEHDTYHLVLAHFALVE